MLLLLLGIIATVVQGHRDTRWPSSSLSSQSAATNANIVVSSSKLSPLMRSVMKMRGGEDDDEQEESEDEESDDEEETAISSSSSESGMDYAAILKQVLDVTKTKIVPSVLEYSKTGLLAARKTSVGIYETLYRAVQAGLEGEELEESDDEDDSDDEEEVTTVVDKILTMTKKSLRTVQRMVKAFITVPEEDGESSDDESEEEEITDQEEDDDVIVEITEDEIAKESETTPVPAANDDDDDDDVENDFGSYLSEAYEINDLRNSGKTKGPIILDGSLQDALQTARQQARMLLVFIPSEKPKGEQGGMSFFGGGKKSTAESEENNLVAIESLLSKEVAKASNKKARKKQTEEFGSFAIWGSKAGSSEAASAIKRLKVKETSTKGEKRSILCVVYPASSGGVVSIDSNLHLLFL